MILVLRHKPMKLEQLEIMRCRAGILGDELNELGNLRLGYEGESELDVLIDSRIRGRDCLHLKDYRFQTRESGRSSSEIQIDNILIAGDRLFTFEVKKYNFDLIYTDDVWTFTSGEKFKNLMQQVSRQNDAFRNLLKKNGADIEVYSCLIFINPKQTIYNLPYGRNILTYSALEKFLDRMVRDNRYSYRQLTNFLESRRVVKSMYDGPVDISLDELRSGVFCESCYEELERRGKKEFYCTRCDKAFTLLRAAQRLIDELKILNSDWPLDSVVIAKYSGNQISSAYIRRQKQFGNLDY